MASQSNLVYWAALWVLAMAAGQFVQWKRGVPSAGLPLAYMLNLWLIHWVGSAIYLFPWYAYHDPAIVEVGFRETTYGLVAFVIGMVVLAPPILRLFELPGRAIVPRVPRPRLAKLYVVIGLVSYMVLSPAVAGVPTATALVAAAGNLLVVGLVLGSTRAWQEHNWAAFLRWLLAITALPFFTLIFQGFVSYGMVAFISAFAFISTFYRPRWKLVLVGFLVAYLGLTVFVSYFRDRPAIREVVFSGQSMTARLSRIYLTLSDLEWFDPNNYLHLRRLDDRLNQNYLVGSSVDYLGGRFQRFAQGDTLTDAVISLIPRAIWPGKPVAAGSGDIVSRYTGIVFAEGTSVGIGQAMEFYINFGTAGVIIGFLVLGIIITAIDISAGRRFASGDWPGFALRYLPGFALLQAGGSLIEVVSSAAAALVMAMMVNRLLGQSPGSVRPNLSQDASTRMVPSRQTRRAAGGAGD